MWIVGFLLLIFGFDNLGRGKGPWLLIGAVAADALILLGMRRIDREGWDEWMNR
jgi:hypothetical protein